MKPDKITFAQIIPLRSPFSFEKQACRTFPLALKEIELQTEKVNFLLWDIEEVEITIQVFNDPESIPFFSRIWDSHKTKYSIPVDWFLKFSGKTHLKQLGFVTESEGKKTKLTKSQDANYSDYSPLAWDFQQRVFDYLFAANIAMPGSINSHPGFTLVGKNLQIETPSFYGDIEYSIRLSLERGWPPVKDLPIKLVWNWLNKLDGFHMGLGKGPIGRGVASYSRLFRSDRGGQDYSQQLIWSLIGLEAIYGRGNQGTKSQLLQKSEVLLGKPPTHKKKFGSAYDNRSRFLHGDLDFPLGHSNKDALSEFEEFSNILSESEKSATAILVSTLQELVIRDIHEAKFSYTLKS